MHINELFTGGAAWEWLGRSRSLTKAHFVVEGQTYEVWFVGVDRGVSVGFMLMREDGTISMGKSGTGNAATVLTTVVSIIKAYVEDTLPPEFYFETTEADGRSSRVSLYSRMAKRLAVLIPDYTMDEEKGSTSRWTFTRRD